nr:immunoglobulin heavy chain junction region [Macaca mulatta]MOV37994.1 immunoglobulin heavy chain junction region [Macaca mulatta]MOV38597.1 immunoglobulin heavy chain junction region [Macaca mulatta]MOV38847.1 immunoglobulin heavy chain junction region [Macaca mulatta]MOV38968.1 immunoglobulin heavy chain junction region [Macaca mulatta]
CVRDAYGSGLDVW